MKTTTLIALGISAYLSTQAQAVIDTVSIGANYTNQVWYSLQNDEQGSSAKNNWDLAFFRDRTGIKYFNQFRYRN